MKTEFFLFALFASTRVLGQALLDGSENRSLGKKPKQHILKKDEDKHHKDSMPPQPHIGIVGGGAAGITTALLLKEKGYQVTILERNKDVGGFAITHKYDGKAYDMGTMFVPGSSLAGPGIEPQLQRMINFSGAKLRPTMDMTTLNITTRLLEAMPEPLEMYTRAELIDQLTRGLFMSFQLFVCAVDNSTCLPCGMVCASANTLLVDWGNEFGVPAYSELLLHVFDGVGGGPTAFEATFKSTLSMSHYVASEVVYVLRKLELKPEDLDPTLPQHPKLFEMLDTERWYFFREGFQTFWKRLVTKAKISVVNHVSVTSMHKNDEEWIISATKGKKNEQKTFQFDQVIVTTAPQDALPFLPDGTAKDLLATAVARVPPNDVFLVRAKDMNTYDNNVDNRRFAFWPTGLGLGSRALADPSSSIDGVKTFFIQKRYAKNDVYYISTYTLDPQIPANVAFEAVKEYAEDKLGLKVEMFLKHERYLFPSGAPPLEKDEFDQNLLQLQGHNGLWFNGEAIAGSGIPRIVQFTEQFVQAFPQIV